METEDVFSPGGALEKALSSYTFRESQLEMADLVSKAFLSGSHAIIEAGTGTGKSFAYLVPAMLSIEKDRSRRFVIATSTITLEKQLYDKDIPVVKEALGLDIETAILFGRSNYLCIRRFNDARNEKSLLNEARTETDREFEKWVTETDSGVLQDLPRSVPVRMFLDFASDDKDCLGYRCPFQQDCFYYGARKKAQRASLVVTNHHLLLLDAKNRGEAEIDFSEDVILPSYQCAVMDEAHHIEDEATAVLSRIYSSWRVERVLDYLTRREKRFGSASILDFLSTEEKERGSGKRTKEDIAHLRTMLGQYDSIVSSILSRFKEKELLFTPQFYDAYGDRLREGEGIAVEMERIGSFVMSAYSDHPSESNEVYVDLIGRYGATLCHLADTLRDWIRFSRWDDEIPYAVEGVDGKAEIHLAPMHTGPLLSRLLVSHLDSMIFSSATLSVNGSFDYFTSRSGLAEEKERLLSGIFASPFDFRRNLMLLLPQDGALFSAGSTESYTGYVTHCIKTAIEASGGGALVLFTSKMMMKAVYASLASSIDDLMIQDDRIPRGRLLSDFRKRKDSSLFAVSSFWEGVDAPGDTLRLVIIVKLPFTAPTTPIVRARSEAIDKHGGSSFMEMMVPEATLRLKQGIGRLIRSESDRGAVLILDGRILRKAYGRMMISSLPDCYIPEDAMLANLGDKIERFLY